MVQSLLNFSISLGILLLSARLLGVLARRLGAPAVIGEILAGVLVGRTLLGRFAPELFTRLFPSGPPQDLLKSFGFVAVLLLVLVAGLEVDLAALGQRRRTVMAVSLLGILAPFLLGWGLGLKLPAELLPDPAQRNLHAAFLGVALAISALPVIAKTLLDLGLLRTELGSLILGSAALDDLAGWMAFGILARLMRPAPGPGLLATMAGLFGFALFLRLLLPALDRLWARRAPSTFESLTALLLLAALGAFLTGRLGLHGVLGAFGVGLALAPCVHISGLTRERLAHLVQRWLAPVFFAGMVLRLDVGSAFNPGLCAVIVVLAFLGKLGGCGLGARWMGLPPRTALAVGFGLNARGAMEILLASLALEAGMIRPALFVALVAMALLTSLVSGPALARLAVGAEREPLSDAAAVEIP